MIILPIAVIMLGIGNLVLLRKLSDLEREVANLRVKVLEEALEARLKTASRIGALGGTGA